MLGSVVPVSPAAYGDASALHARFPAGGTTFPREPKDAGSNPNRPSVTQRSRAADARRVRRAPPRPRLRPRRRPRPRRRGVARGSVALFSRRFVLGSRAASTSASAPHASHPTLPGAHGEAGADASTRFGASKSVRSPFEVLRRRSARGGVLGRLPSKAVISPAAGAAAGLRRRDGRVSKGVSRGGPPPGPRFRDPPATARIARAMAAVSLSASRSAGSIAGIFGPAAGAAPLSAIRSALGGRASRHRRTRRGGFGARRGACARTPRGRARGPRDRRGRRGHRRASAWANAARASRPTASRGRARRAARRLSLPSPSPRMSRTPGAYPRGRRADVPSRERARGPRRRGASRARGEPGARRAGRRWSRVERRRAARGGVRATPAGVAKTPRPRTDTRAQSGESSSHSSRAALLLSRHRFSRQRARDAIARGGDIISSFSRGVKHSTNSL